MIVIAYDYTYLLVQEVQISSALVLGLVSLACLLFLLSIPVGLIVIPLIFLAVVVSGLEVEVVTESLIAVCYLLAVTRWHKWHERLTLLSGREGAE
jgi:uncharacterized membrane protein YGL010W